MSCWLIPIRKQLCFLLLVPLGSVSLGYHLAMVRHNFQPLLLAFFLDSLLPLPRQLLSFLSTQSFQCELPSNFHSFGSLQEASIQLPILLFIRLLDLSILPDCCPALDAPHCHFPSPLYSFSLSL